MPRAMMQEVPAFVWTTRVRYVDTDTSGRIHYTALFRYFEAAEQEFLRTIGFPYSGQPRAETGWPRVHAECDISGPLVFDDEISVEVSVARVGSSSIALAYRVVKGTVESARGKVVIVCLDRATEKSRPLPADFAEALRSRMEPE